MKYIIHKRFKAKAICGEVNLPALTECEEHNNIIFFQGYPICAIQSENAHQFFAVNEDGKGLERGKLTQAIQKILAKTDAKKQDKWDKVWADSVCRPFKREEYDDYWLWNHDFFQADIKTLRYIHELIRS